MDLRSKANKEALIRSLVASLPSSAFGSASPTAIPSSTSSASSSATSDHHDLAPLLSTATTTTRPVTRSQTTAIIDEVQSAAPVAAPTINGRRRRKAQEKKLADTATAATGRTSARRASIAPCAGERPARRRNALKASTPVITVEIPTIPEINAAVTTVSAGTSSPILQSSTGADYSIESQAADEASIGPTTNAAASRAPSPQRRECQAALVDEDIHEVEMAVENDNDDQSAISINHVKEKAIAVDDDDDESGIIFEEGQRDVVLGDDDLGEKFGKEECSLTLSEIEDAPGTASLHYQLTPRNWRKSSVFESPFRFFFSGKEAPGGTAIPSTLNENEDAPSTPSLQHQPTQRNWRKSSVFESPFRCLFSGKQARGPSVEGAAIPSELNEIEDDTGTQTLHQESLQCQPTQRNWRKSSVFESPFRFVWGGNRSAGWKGKAFVTEKENTPVFEDSEAVQGQ
ncbi:hypothetical protein DFJ73DRAFT_808496 [Zopfochytrium polystomum]|nr:hypothetical protein DFJ73DRAFT_808496 [Zopfochytrium polystomum]